MVAILVDISIVCAAIVATTAALATPPVRWILKTLVGAPATVWLSVVVVAVIDEKINGGVEHLNKRLTRLETERGLDPMHYQRKDGTKF